MKIETNNLINKYLSETTTMQIATLHDGKPWICTVYYVEDEKGRLYWLSLPTRQHSQDILVDNHIAVVIAVKQDRPVIGMQMEGTAEVIDDKPLIQKIMKKYVDKYSSGKDFYDNFLGGKNRHQMYCFTPNKTVLFDELNFPDKPQQENSGFNLL